MMDPDTKEFLEQKSLNTGASVRVNPVDVVEELTGADAELFAMRKLVDVFAALHPGQRVRVVRYLCSRFSVSP